MPIEYDTIIIGAGIAGASLAYTLTQQNQKVLLLDKRGIAKGGSGAAGAFVSPKIGKGSPLLTLTNQAFISAKDFYLSTCPTHFHQTGVLRIPKDAIDAIKFAEYESYMSNSYQHYSKERLQDLGIKCHFDSVYFDEAGDCDAVKVCHALLQGIDVVIHEVKTLKQENNLWAIDHYRSKNIVLATGYENDLVDIRYMGIKGIWGTRADFSSALALPMSMHQSMSVGANKEGIIKIGATHEREIYTAIRCKEAQALALKEKASALIDTSDLVLKNTFCGMRAGCRDYFPILGSVIDVAYMLEQYPSIKKGSKAPLQYLQNLYVFNGLGGRGFVFAPMMAEILASHITKGKEIDRRVCADRLFLKWCRKL